MVILLLGKGNGGMDVHCRCLFALGFVRCGRYSTTVTRHWVGIFRGMCKERWCVCHLYSVRTLHEHTSTSEGNRHSILFQRGLDVKPNRHSTQQSALAVWTSLFTVWAAQPYLIHRPGRRGSGGSGQQHAFGLLSRSGKHDRLGWPLKQP